MKIISWNINGIRAVCKKGFLDWFNQAGTDIVCLQEIKAKVEQVPEELRAMPGWFSYFNPAEKPGYSGTAVFCKEKPLRVEQGIGLKRFDDEGRVLRLKFADFELFNFYIPFGGREKQSLDYKLNTYKHLCKELSSLQKGVNLILVGDFNIAHKEIDLARPKDNKNNIMFTPEERKQIDKLLELGFCDSFRKFYPNKTGQYTWWGYYRNLRQRNVGWRIDYCFTSKALTPKLKQAFILPQVMGSDHCPVGVVLK